MGVQFTGHILFRLWRNLRRTTFHWQFRYIYLLIKSIFTMIAYLYTALTTTCVACYTVFFRACYFIIQQAYMMYCITCRRLNANECLPCIKVTGNDPTQTQPARSYRDMTFFTMALDLQDRGRAHVPLHFYARTGNRGQETQLHV